MITKLIISIRSKWFYALAAASVLTAIVIAGVITIAMHLNLSGCNDIGCAVMEGLIIQFIGYVGAGTFVALVLKYARLPYWLPVAAFATVLLYTARFMDLAIPHVPYEVSFVLWLIIESLLSLCVSYLVIVKVKCPAWLKVVLAIGVVAMAYFAVPAVFNVVDGKLYDRQQQTAIAHAGFKLYKPTYLPDGYSLHSENYTKADANTRANDELDYLYGTNELDDPTPFQILEMNVKDVTFSPPKNCGDNTAIILSNPLPAPCNEIGRGKDKVPVYFSGPEYTDELTAYEKVGDTLILLKTTLGKPISKGEMVRILASVQPR